MQTADTYACCPSAVFEERSRDVEGCCTSSPQERSSSCLKPKQKYLSYAKRKFLSPSRKPLWGDGGRSGRWLRSQPLGRSNGEPDMGRRERETSTFGGGGLFVFGVFFVFKQRLHFIQRKACPARGSTAKLQNSYHTRTLNVKTKQGVGVIRSCVRKGMGGGGGTQKSSYLLC